MTIRVPGRPVLDWHRSGKSAVTPPPDAVFDAPWRLWTTSGRAAIAVALMDAGLGQGATVLLPTYHCPTMVCPARHLGLNIEFFPLRERGDPDLDFVESRLRSGQIRALLIAHYFGFPQPMRAIREICDRYGVILIEDCAHTLFGTTDGKPIGSWGDYAIGSLTKFLPISWGGCLVSYRHPIGEHLRHEAPLLQKIKKRLDVFESASCHGRPAGVGPALHAIFQAKNRLRRTPREDISPEPSTHPTVDSGLFHLDERAALTRPSRHVARTAIKADRRSIADRRRDAYESLLKRTAFVPRVTVVQPSLSENVVPYVFPILAERPDEIFRQARRSGVPVYRWNWLWPDTPRYQGDGGRIWSENLLQLPCHQNLTAADIEQIACSISPAKACP